MSRICFYEGENVCQVWKYMDENLLFLTFVVILELGMYHFIGLIQFFGAGWKMKKSL